MLINIPDQDVFETLSGLKYKHRQSNCTYCGDNLDGSPSECSLAYLIRLIEKQYRVIKELT
jgi:hypothetical protein